MALLHRVIRWVPLACSICFTSKGKSFQPAPILAIKAIGCTASEQGKEEEKRGTQERMAGSVFSWITTQWKNSNDVHYLNHLHACVPGCVVCIGREAANECSVALQLSHSERPEYMEAVEMANTAHQILSAAASVSAVQEAARERTVHGRHTNLFTS